jgi:putative transposase
MRVWSSRGKAKDAESRFSDERIAAALKQVEAGVRVADLGRQLGVRGAGIHRWWARYGRLGVSEVKWLCHLGAGNTFLGLMGYSTVLVEVRGRRL